MVNFQNGYKISVCSVNIYFAFRRRPAHHIRPLGSRHDFCATDPLGQYNAVENGSEKSRNMMKIDEKWILPLTPITMWHNVYAEWFSDVVRIQARFPRATCLRVRFRETVPFATFLAILKGAVARQRTRKSRTGTNTLPAYLWTMTRTANISRNK